MPTAIKEMMLQEIRKELKDSPYAFISSLKGLTVSSVTELRRNLEKVSRGSMMVKHTLAAKVFTEMNVAEAANYLKESVLITVGDKDPQNISKVILDFSKANDKFVPSAMIFENKVYGGEFVKQLARLPSRHELLTQVVVRIKSPITGLVMTLNQLVRGVVVALNEVKKKKRRQRVPKAHS